MTEWCQRFISLGDNCEFGLIERGQGFDRGGLLKWCRINQFRDVLNFLPLRRKDLYRFENLRPAYDDMVLDKSSNILFHSEMYSIESAGGRQFVYNESELKFVYEKEKEKRDYLADKLEADLRSGDYISIFKMNGVFDPLSAEILNCKIREYNRSNRLLYLTDVFPGKCSHIDDFGRGLLVGYVERFSPYYPVSDACSVFWDAVCARLAL